MYRAFAGTTSRDMFSLCAIVLLCWAAAGHAAAPDCEELLRPLSQVDFHHLEGRRTMIAGSLSDPTLMERLGRRDSASIAFSNDTESGLAFSRSLNMGDECTYTSYNITLDGVSFTFSNGSISTTFINSCADCLLLRFNVEAGKRQHFYLFSSRRELGQEEMERYKAQVQCLNMPPPAVMDPTKDLCPERAVDNSADGH